MRTSLPVDWSTLHKVLHDETRKKIIQNLQSAGTLSYTDLMNRLEITNTGKLNYHLKKLNDLVTKDSEGSYRLTDRGSTAAELLQKFPSQSLGTRGLRGSDALLIGIFGFILTVLPAFPTLFMGFFASPLLIFLYLLIIPGYIMRHMVLTRSESHDLYELMKPPVVEAGIFYLILAVIFIVSYLRGVSPLPPPTLIGDNIFIQISLIGVIALPAFPALGISLIEAFQRIRNR